MRISTFIVFTSFILSSIYSSAQVSDQVSLSPGYTTQSFYSLANGELANVDNTNWDIAFMTDAFNSSILINDNINTQLYLYASEAADYATVDTTGFDWTPLRNSEIRWEKGAFISPQIAGDPFDYGWGLYDPFVTHQVQGNRVFILGLADGSYKKVFIEALNNGLYTFKYADLNGDNEVNEAIDIVEYAERNFVYYSVSTAEVIDREPIAADWDITFTRWSSEVAPEFYYTVAGALHNLGKTSAQADDLPTDEAFWSDYSPSEDINTIGADWKYFDMDIFQYVLEDSLSYFIPDADGNVWQIIFTGFGGSADGVIAFTKEMVSSVGLGESAAIEFSMFPNPSLGDLTVVLPVHSTQVHFTLVDVQGRALQSGSWTQGFEHNMSLTDVPAGVYILQIEMNGAVGQKRLVVR